MDWSPEGVEQSKLIWSNASISVYFLFLGRYCRNRAVEMRR